MIGPIRLVRELDPAVPITGVRTMESVVATSLSHARLTLSLIGSFAVAAMLLAVLGLYGVVADTVARRTHEIGVRRALGAMNGSLLTMVLLRGLRLTLVGAAMGLVGALATGRLLEGLLVGVEPTDPAILTAVTLFLTLLTLVASLVPAVRALRVDPREALRSD